ncbi:ABC transporter substrate-binding protein [Thiomonas sp. X19]|uniref:ABC transporter substrate-binding protein n=1 Tax=Thiomonas sp. X19 TaxID=1050370 RepID=UPI00131492CC|nr:toprim domain-containing protein [Thiomonas sp. X19]
MKTTTITHDRAELTALRQLPPQAVAEILGLTHDQAAQRQHGGAGYSYWRTSSDELITVCRGRTGWIWHPTKRGAGGGGDWLALHQHINQGANLGHARRALRQALAGGHAAPARASMPLPAPQAAAATVEPPKPLALCEAPAWAIDYLHGQRGIPLSTIKHALAMRAVAGHVPGHPPYPRAVHLAFPHVQPDQAVTWAELRGPRETDVARSKKGSRGKKGLWILPPVTESRVLVVTESAIKGLALHARLAQASKPAWVVSTGGDPGQHQQQMLAWLVDELGIETAALAQDNDTPGHHQADRLVAALRAPGAKVVRMAPPAPCKGWDDWVLS